MTGLKLSVPVGAEFIPLTISPKPNQSASPPSAGRRPHTRVGFALDAARILFA